MRIALGVLAADAGEVRWNGRAIDLDTRRRIGYMPEERGLYPRMKVLDQLVYLAELHGMSTNDAHTSAENWIARLGLRDRRTDEVQRLSLGNQQRVQLAAALVHDPDVLVLDEPFSGLDPVAVDVMSQVLREKASAGVPVVFSSHQLDLVERLCDRVGIVSAGTMVAVGTVDELRSGGGVPAGRGVANDRVGCHAGRCAGDREERDALRAGARRRPSTTRPCCTPRSPPVRCTSSPGSARR